ncbi:Ig-like domain-containing protein, partial [bacterium]|nr:Ig-like domain-containing protein [bacterium]
SFAIAGGVDSGQFKIDSVSGLVSFINAPDFDSPSDTGLDNIYDLIIKVSDPSNDSTTNAIKISVTNIDEGSSLVSPSAISLNEDFGTTSVILLASDPENDPITYTASSSDTSIINVGDINQNILNINSIPNANGSAFITVNASSSGGSDTQTFHISVNPVNDAPTITNIQNDSGIISTEVFENQIQAITLEATDIEGNTPFSYTITGGVDSGKFTINSASGAIHFVTTPDFEIPEDTGGNNIYDLLVTVSDSGNISTTYAVQISVADLFENLAPTVYAGLDLDIPYSQTIPLTGALASDPNNNLQTITWTQIAGPEVTIFDSNTISPTITIPIISKPVLTLTFKVTVTDELGLSHSDELLVLVRNPQAPLVAEAVLAVRRIIGVKENAITSTDQMSSTEVKLNLKDTPYDIQAIKGLTGWHIGFVSKNPSQFDLASFYSPLGVLLQGATFEELALVISESIDSIDTSNLTSDQINPFRNYANDEGQLDLNPGIKFFSSIKLGNGELKRVTDLILGGTLAPEPLRFSGQLNKDALEGILQGALEGAAENAMSQEQTETTSSESETPSENEEEEPESYLESLNETDDDSKTLLDFTLDLPALTPFPFNNTNDRQKFHVEYEETSFNITISDANEITASATRKTNLWFLNNQETIDSVVTLNFEGQEFINATIDGETTVNWVDSLGVRVPDFKVKKILLSGELNPASEDEETSTDNSSQSNQTTSGSSSLDKIELGLGIGLEVEIFGQEAMHIILGVHLAEGLIDEVSMTFQSADENSAGLDLKKIPVINAVPIIKELTLGHIIVGINPQSKDYYFSTQAVWTSKGIHGHLGIMMVDNEPTVLLRVDNLHLNHLVSGLPSDFGNLGFPIAAIAISKADLADVELDDLPSGIQELLGGIVDDAGGNVPVTDGVTVLTALTVDTLPGIAKDAFNTFGIDNAALTKMGVEGPLVLAGSIGGVFGGQPSAALSVILPKVILPPAFGENSPIGKIVSFNDVQGSFFIRYYSVNSAVEIGISGDMSVDIPRLDDASKVDTLSLEGSVFYKTSPTGGVGVAVRGKIGGLWNEPLGLK